MELDSKIQTLTDPNVLFSAICPYCKKPTRVSRLMNIECCGKKYPIPDGIPPNLFKGYVLGELWAENEYTDRMDYMQHKRI